MYGFYQARQEDFTCHTTFNNCYPPHLHKQTELIYMIKGKLKSTVDGLETVLSAGDMSICFPNLVHSTQSLGDSQAILIIFDTAFVEAFSNELLKSSPEIPFIKKSCLPESAKSCFNMILQSYTAREDLRISMGYLYLLLAAVLPHLNLISNKKTDLWDTCHLILEYINSHFTEDINLDSISKSLNISKYYISHIFSDKIKTSFPSYLNRCRIDYARNLLRSTSDSITEIGFNSGFNSSRTFYRTFRECYNQSPKEYRDKHFSRS